MSFVPFWIYRAQFVEDVWEAVSHKLFRDLHQEWRNHADF